MKQTCSMNKRAIVSILAIGMLLAACEKKNEDMTVGQKLDAVVADVKAEGKALKADAQDARASVAQSMEETNASAQAKSKELNTAISDTAIVAAVNVRLAQDKDLEANKIEVLVDKGHLILKGTAPSEAAIERAVSLAKGTDGVVAVDSQLTVAKN